MNNFTSLFTVSQGILRFIIYFAYFRQCFVLFRFISGGVTRCILFCIIPAVSGSIFCFISIYFRRCHSATRYILFCIIPAVSGSIFCFISIYFRRCHSVTRCILFCIIPAVSGSIFCFISIYFSALSQCTGSLYFVSSLICDFASSNY